MTNTLAALYSGWDVHNQRIINMIAPLTPEQLLLSSAPHMWHVSILVAHLVGARAFWFHTIMQEGRPGIAAWSGLDDDVESARPVEQLVRGLNETWTMISEVLNQRTLPDLDTAFERVYPSGVETFTRQAVILRVMNHDAHHAGEISQILGMHGVAAMDW